MNGPNFWDLSGGWRTIAVSSSGRLLDLGSSMGRPHVEMSSLGAFLLKRIERIMTVPAGGKPKRFERGGRSYAFRAPLERAEPVEVR